MMTHREIRLETMLVDTVKCFVSSNWTDFPEQVVRVEKVLEIISPPKRNGLIRWLKNHTRPDKWRGYFLE